MGVPDASDTVLVGYAGCLQLPYFGEAGGNPRPSARQATAVFGAAVGTSAGHHVGHYSHTASSRSILIDPHPPARVRQRLRACSSTLRVVFESFGCAIPPPTQFCTTIDVAYTSCVIQHPPFPLSSLLVILPLLCLHSIPIRITVKFLQRTVLDGSHSHDYPAVPAPSDCQQPVSTLMSGMNRSEMGSIVAAAGKLAQEGDRLLRSQRPALSLAARTLRLGATPSLTDCVSGLQEIWWVL